MRVIGPGGVLAGEIGMMPLRLTSPTVGLRPTMPATAAGQMMLPSVSVPIADGGEVRGHRGAGAGLEPQGLRSSA